MGRLGSITTCLSLGLKQLVSDLLLKECFAFLSLLFLKTSISWFFSIIVSAAERDGSQIYAREKRFPKALHIEDKF